jgi:hypothetical protein
LRYRLRENTRVTLALFDARGTLMRQERDAEQGAGGHAAVFDRSMLRSGIYLYRIIAGEQRETGKFAVVK